MTPNLGETTVRTLCIRTLRMFLLLSGPLLGLAAAAQAKDEPEVQKVIRSAVGELLKMQEGTGRWSYEALHRDEEEEDGLPYGFQVAGTAIVSQALLFGAPDDKAAQAAVRRGLTFIMKQLDHPKMAPLTEESYDVRIWAHGFTLEFLCHARARKVVGEHAKQVNEWIPKLIEALEKEEGPDGGWNYASRSSPATFVTAPILQALLLAQSQGEKVPAKLFDRGRKMLEAARMEDGAFVYADSADDPARRALPGSTLGGSASRALVCETTLALLGRGSIKAVQAAIDNFYAHWDDLEERRAQSGTHQGQYNIAPYYFYYGHRYAAQAIQMLPEGQRAKERERLLKPILKTRDEDGTWNDREFERDRNLGTAMMVLALLGDKMPLPPKLANK